jgi:hypothetical protein
MNCHDNGTLYTIEFEYWDLWCWSEFWCKALAIQAHEGWFQFDKASGDLIESGGDAAIESDESDFNSEFYALFSHDCQKYAAQHFSKKGEVIYLKPLPEAA